ncbi:cyclic peptide export ABC transporter [Opitutus sp. ER46]|uniref:cyclic peptide export ABC transporter n=1 Tax=Opitutus sp. ER46 TaxID=2161864 RepID=UPI001304CB27|nr:cyclic peptide export ABC transporter [Opitutus sp. ER46]
MKRILLVCSVLNILLRKYRLQVVLSVIASITAGLCSSGVLALINLRLKGVDSFLDVAVPLLFAALVVVYLVTSFLAEYLHIQIAEHELANLRFQLSKQILDLPLRNLETIGSSNLFASLTSDLDRIILIIFKIPSFILNLSTVIGCGVYIAVISPAVAAVSLVYLAICYCAFVLPFRLSEKYVARARERWDALCRSFHAVTHGAKELLMHDQRRTTFLNDRIKQTCDNIRSDRIKGRAIQNFCYHWGDCLYFIGLGSLLFLVAPYLELRDKNLTSIIWGLLYMVLPLHFLIDWGPDFQNIAIAINKLKSIGFSFAYDRAPTPSPTGVTPLVHTSDQPLLELSKIRFTYYNRDENETFSVGPISLTIARNSVVFLTGGNGSGKTTLMKILCGLYPAESGELRWNGELIDEPKRGLYRQMFSVVFSDFYLFDEAFGLDVSPYQARVDHYIARLQLQKKLTVQESRLSTTDLSQGQRKRIALLIAFLEDRPFYVFDEWAADQDPVFKRIFYHEILPDLKEQGKTVLVISHDDAYYGVADRVIKLEDGHLKETPAA